MEHHCQCKQPATEICPFCHEVGFCNNKGCNRLREHKSSCDKLLENLTVFELYNEAVKRDPSLKKLLTLCIHKKARGAHPAYPARFTLSEDFVDWAVEFKDYAPVSFTAPSVIANDCTIKQGGWADPQRIEDVDFSKRVSYEGVIRQDSQKYPLNPKGRTGMRERGLLGKWGPNHAADPIVMRKNPKTQMIEMVAIKRKDTGEWAIPGGMVDAGEQISVTLRREFEEEAGNVGDDQKEEFRKHLDKLFHSGILVYKGYVDDPRNTDNAWMETVAMLFPCDSQLGLLLHNLNAGDDAADVQWLCIQDSNATYANLYASHKPMVDIALKIFLSL